MKRHMATALAMVLLVICMAACSESAKQETKDEKVSPQPQKQATPDKPALFDGFRGIKWFTKKTAIPDLYKDDYQKYLKKNDNNSLGDIPLEGIEYDFNSAEELSGIVLQFKPIHFEKVCEYLAKTLGNNYSQNTQHYPDYLVGGKNEVLTVLWDFPQLEVAATLTHSARGITSSRVTITAKKAKGSKGGSL